MHLLLIRHGESTNNAILHHQKIENEEQFRKLKQDNPGLTAKGQQQAYYTGTFLRSKLDPAKVDLVSSTLRRARRTAELAFPNTQCVPLELFNEWDKYTESLEDVQDRIETVLAFIQSKAKFHGDEAVMIIFGHSLFFSLLISRIIAGQRTSSLSVEFPNCSITNLHVDPNTEHIAVYQMGKVNHLDYLATAVHTVYGC